MKYIQLLKIITSMLPLIIDAIKTIEAAIPGEGKGEAKLAAVRGILESAYTISNDTLGKFDDIWPAIASVIGILVQTFNKTGTFKK